MGLNLLKSGSITYGEMYIIKRLNTRKNPQTYTHHNDGLAWIIHSATPAIRTISTVERRRDLIKSTIQSFGVIVLKPYLFSILKVLYRLNGTEIMVLA